MLSSLRILESRAGLKKKGKKWSSSNVNIYYTAPEILLSGQKATTASDIWSFGCTLAELYTEEECWASYDLPSNARDNSSNADDSIESLKEYMKKQLTPYSTPDALDKSTGSLIKRCL